ncbi:MAG: acyltransferase [Ruminococcaceae bacterium]|nr:acyltransferase [Oscillospiraceae bacterium]
MFTFISILRAVATMLITNSHFGSLYPIPDLATGGALGNSLFFLVSGFCLYKPKTDFKSWYLKRLIRLYTPLILFNLYVLLKTENVFKTLLFDFIFPQRYWFVCALIVMYPILYYIIMHKFERKQFLICTAILCVLYASIYFMLDKQSYVVETIGIYGIRFSYIFSFFLMLLGAYLRKNVNKFIELVQDKKIAYWFVLNFVCYYIFLVTMQKFKFLLKLQFVETLLCIGTVVTFFLLLIGMEKYLSKYKNKPIFKVFEFLGSLTLEIYIVQFVLIDLINNLKLVFPLNCIVALSAILVAAVILNKVSTKVIKLIFKKEKQ